MSAGAINRIIAFLFLINLSINNLPGFVYERFDDEIGP
jgi:hypothetical protein